MTSWWIQFSSISEGADLELETERQDHHGQGPQAQGQILPCPE